MGIGGVGAVSSSGRTVVVPAEQSSIMWTTTLLHCAFKLGPVSRRSGVDRCLSMKKLGEDGAQQSTWKGSAGRDSHSDKGYREQTIMLPHASRHLARASS